MSTILITGGSGFIGTHLHKVLIQKGFKVKILDLVQPQNLDPHAEYIQGDVKDPACVEKALESVDTVFHFAGIVGITLCQEQLLESYATNLLGTLTLSVGVKKRNQLRKNRPIKIVFSSSAAVYGNSGTSHTALSENIIPQPISFYGAQKLNAEQALQLCFQTHSIPVISFRFFNVFGPGQDPSSPYSSVISTFCDAALNEKPIFIHGDGLQSRDFVSVHDICRACILALDLPAETSTGSPINLGSGHKTNILTLANEISHLTQKKLTFKSLPHRPSDIQHSLADIQRAKNVLNWIPNVSLRDGLEEILSSERDSLE